MKKIKLKMNSIKRFKSITKWHIIDKNHSIKKISFLGIIYTEYTNRKLIINRKLTNHEINASWNQCVIKLTRSVKNLHFESIKLTRIYKKLHFRCMKLTRMAGNRIKNNFSLCKMIKYCNCTTPGTLYDSNQPRWSDDPDG